MKPGDNGNLKLALYTRVSTEDQAKEGFSLEAQLKRIRAYCEAQQYEIISEYIDDGYSGRNTRRPKYQEMISNINNFDGIIVLKMDRIHRNSKNFMKMMDNLAKQDKEFISATESLDTSTAMGRFVMDIIQRMAQLESEVIGERVTIGMDQKAQDLTESYSGGRPAYGYSFDEGKIKTIPEDLELVRKAFNLYAENSYSINQICEILYGPRKNKKNRHHEMYGSVRYWFTNIFYVGYHQWTNHFKLMEMEYAISLDLWNVVQSKRCKNSKIVTGEKTCSCGSSDISKAGKRGSKQRWKCKSCGHRFVLNPAKAQGPSKPFILNERVEYFNLTNEELKHFGLNKHRKKHKI